MYLIYNQSSEERVDSPECGTNVRVFVQFTQLKKPVVFFPPDARTGNMRVDKAHSDSFDLEHAFYLEYYVRYCSYLTTKWWFKGLDETLGRVRFIKDILISIENGHAYQQMAMLKQAQLYASTSRLGVDGWHVSDVEMMLRPNDRQAARSINLGLTIDAIWIA